MLWRKVVPRMDQQSEQAVWRRVKAKGSVTAEEALLPERLEALILQERADAAALRMLSRRMGGQGSAPVSRAAASSEARARTLVTLHYLLSGRRLRLQTPPCGKQDDLPEALRQASLRMEQTAAAYASLAKEFPERGELFSGLSCQARGQYRALTARLQSLLCARF